MKATRQLLLVCVVASAAAWAAPKGAAKRAKTPSVIPVAPTKLTGPAGEVKYLTSTLAYLNRGSDDGLTVGTNLTFSRGGRAVGACTVDTIAEHWATCLAGALRKGDTFAVARKPAEAAPGPWLELASEQELAARRDLLAAHEAALVDFAAENGGADAHHASVSIGNTSYRNFAAPGTWQVQRVDAAVYDVDLYKGLRASLDLSVLNFSQRPLSFRSVYAGTPVLLVRQVELGFRREDVPFSAAVGRIWTRATPGLLVVDGAQAGYRAGDWLEVGLYGGLLPNEYSLTLSTRQWTTGAFVQARFLTGKGAESTFIQTEARLGYAVKDQLGGRFEAGLGAHIYQGKTLDGHLGLELGYGGPNQALGGIDAARVDLGWRPNEKLRLLAGARYRGGSPLGQIELGQVSPGQRAVHGDVGATYELMPFLWLGLQTGLASDFDAGLTQARVGPEVTLPTLFGRGGGLQVGYTEEFGWLRARHAYLQLVFNVFGRVRVLTRTSWFRQISAGLDANEIGETVNLDVTIFRWLWARAQVSGRTQLEVVEGPSRTAGLVSFQLGGQF